MTDLPSAPRTDPFYGSYTIHATATGGRSADDAYAVNDLLDVPPSDRDRCHPPRHRRDVARKAEAEGLWVTVP